jgi:ribokinase
LTRILISGSVSIETGVRVDGFPLPYSGVAYPFFGVHSGVSGVGYNLARALTTLGNRVALLAVTGDDVAAQLIAAALRKDGIDDAGVLRRAAATAQSVVLYDPTGRRQIFTDLKDIQEVVYPPELFRAAAADCALAVLSNINFSRPLLREAQRMGLPIATDVHAISALDDSYNKAFMAAAQVLFMSHERLPLPPAQWIRKLWQRFGAEVVVIGLGAAGAMLGVRSANAIEQFAAPAVRPVVNTVGAGDALFAAFLHAYAAGTPADEALRLAQVFAGYKIGASGGGGGFLTAAELADWRARLA